MTGARSLAHRKPDGAWSKPAKAAQARKPGPYDHVKPLGPAVTVVLDKGAYY